MEASQEDELQSVRAELASAKAALDNLESTREELGSSRVAFERELAAVRRTLEATRAREADFRQATFDLNAELLGNDEQLEALKAELATTLAVVLEREAELTELRTRVADLEGILHTRGVRAVIRWWRLKARILGRS